MHDTETVPDHAGMHSDKHTNYIHSNMHVMYPAEHIEGRQNAKCLLYIHACN